MLPVATRPLMVLHALLDKAQALGDTPAGNRKIVNVTGGSFEGERCTAASCPAAATGR
jgi:hypothetical protein